MSNKFSEEDLKELVTVVGFFVCVAILCIKGQGVEEYILPMLFTYLLPSPIHSLIKQPTVTKGSGTTQAQRPAHVTPAETGTAEASKGNDTEAGEGITEVSDGLTDTLKV